MTAPKIDKTLKEFRDKYTLTQEQVELLSAVETSLYNYLYKQTQTKAYEQNLTKLFATFDKTTMMADFNRAVISQYADRDRRKNLDPINTQIMRDRTAQIVTAERARQQQEVAASAPSMASPAAIDTPVAAPAPQKKTVQFADKPVIHEFEKGGVIKPPKATAVDISDLSELHGLQTAQPEGKGIPVAQGFVEATVIKNMSPEDLAQARAAVSVINRGNLAQQARGAVNEFNILSKIEYIRDQAQQLMGQFSGLIRQGLEQINQGAKRLIDNMKDLKQPAQKFLNQVVGFCGQVIEKCKEFGNKMLDGLAKGAEKLSKNCKDIAASLKPNINLQQMVEGIKSFTIRRSNKVAPER
jgi:hypothetical protein